MDAERRAWLEKLAETCERVLADDEGDRTDRSYAALREDVAGLLSWIRSQLDSKGAR